MRSPYHFAPKVGSSSPWGPVQIATVLAKGIVAVSTAGHGGIWLAPWRQSAMPAHLVIDDGWYEEDCEWARVAVTFPDAFQPEHVEAAKRMNGHFVKGGV